MSTNKPIDAPLPDNVRVLKNGAIYDMTKKKIVGLRPELAIESTQITRENASSFYARKQERKREILQASALQAVERDDLRLTWGDDAWIAEIGYNMQKKATNIDDPKMVDAARFLLKETGRSDEAGTGDVADILGGVADIVRELSAFARVLAVPADADVIPMRKDNVLDADVQEG